MTKLFIDPSTNDIRKEVMYVAYAVTAFIVVCAVLITINAITNPQDISFGELYD